MQNNQKESRITEHPVVLPLVGNQLNNSAVVTGQTCLPRVLSRGAHRLYGILIGLVVVAVSQLAWAQGKIPYDIVTSTSALTSSQTTKIDAYVHLRMQKLLAGVPDQVSLAREELIEPFGWVGASDTFTLAYSSAVSDRLVESLHSHELLVKLNGVIVAASLIDSGVVRLIEIALSDDNAALRYWAAKAVGDDQISGVSRVQRDLSRDKQLVLLEALQKAIAQENQPVVFHRLMLSVVALDITEADDYLLDELNRRVAQYALKPNESVSPMARVLRAMYIDLVQASARGKPVSPELRQKTTVAAFRYLVFSATVLDRVQLDATAKLAYKEMIDLTDSILIWVAQTTFPAGTPWPSSIKNELEIENWPEILLRAEEWRQLLTGPAFELDQQDLAIASVQ